MKKFKFVSNLQFTDLAPSHLGIVRKNWQLAIEGGPRVENVFRCLVGQIDKPRVGFIYDHPAVKAIWRVGFFIDPAILAGRTPENLGLSSERSGRKICTAHSDDCMNHFARSISTDTKGSKGESKD